MKNLSKLRFIWEKHFEIVNGCKERKSCCQIGDFSVSKILLKFICECKVCSQIRIRGKTYEMKHPIVWWFLSRAKSSVRETHHQIASFVPFFLPFNWNYQSRVWLFGRCFCCLSFICLLLLLGCVIGVCGRARDCAVCYSPVSTTIHRIKSHFLEPLINMNDNNIYVLFCLHNFKLIFLLLLFLFLFLHHFHFVVIIIIIFSL